MSESKRDCVPLYPCNEKPRRSATIRRRSSRLSLVLAIAVFVALFTAGNPVPTSRGFSAQAAAQPDQVIVKFKSSASESAIRTLNFAMASQQVDAIPVLGIHIVRVPFGRSAETVAAAYARNPLVEFAEVNALVEPEVVPNDPEYDNVYGGAWHLPIIQAPEAWDESLARGTLVAICDTGVATVPDLVPALRGDLGYNTVNNSGDWSPVAGHGTITAGAAGAATDNSLGVASVGWGSRLIPVRITNSSSGTAYVSDAAECLTYAADHGARVANLSYRMAGYSTINSAAEYGRTRGMVTVVSAGNDGIDPGWTDYPAFLAVSSTDKQDALPSWSNYGQFVDIAAPGINIWTTKQDGTYWTSSGTSLSAPVVSGALALMFGANPEMSAEQAEEILLETADDIGAAGPDSSFGAGRINARKAVIAAQAAIGSPAPVGSPTPYPSVTPTVVSSVSPTPTRTSTPFASTSTPTPAGSTPMASGPTPTPTSPPLTSTPSPLRDLEPPTVTLTNPAASLTISGKLTLEARASDNIRVASVAFYVGEKLLKTDEKSPYAIPWNTREWPNGTYVITAVAQDDAGNAAVDGTIVTVKNSKR